MKKRLLVPIILLLAIGAAWFFRAEIRAWFESPEHELFLYGNVDDRRLNLAFLIQERIGQLLPEEGTAVKEGELLGSLETTRLENDVKAARAAVATNQAAVTVAEAAYEKAKNGSRKEDIAMAEGGIAAVLAKIKAAELESQRQKRLLQFDASSARTEESAEADFLFLKAGLGIAQTLTARLTAGERPEDIASAAGRLEQAKGQLSQSEAEWVIREQKLRDAKLYAPRDGVICKRLLEPGEMAGPQQPALMMAVVSPKWIRVYMPEIWLPKVKTGDPARIRFDGAEGEFEGWVGFISPYAEFTPKNVETPELRTSLVYEFRVYVKDPENRLKLGAPATVIFPGVMVK